jgi:HD superfamily phosphodiesterase
MTNMTTNISKSSSFEPILELIAKQVQHFYAGLDAWHNISHGRRVVDLATRINKTECGDNFLVEAGAWLHQFHDNLDQLDELLETLPLVDKQREQLFEIVEYCRPHKISNECSLEAKIVFDADALELVGPSGIFREVLCNVISRRQQVVEAIESARQVQEMFVEKLQTRTAHRLAESVNSLTINFWIEYRQWESMFN